MSVAAGAAEVVIMPALHRAMETGCEATVRRVLSQWTVRAIIPISLMVILIAWGLSPGAGLVVILLLLPLPVFAAQSSLQMGLLNASGRFLRAVMGPVYGGLVAIPLLFIVPLSAVGLAGVLLGFEAGRYAGLRLSVVGSDETADRSPTGASDVLSWALRGATVQALASLMSALNPMVDMLFARYLGFGAVSSVEYANRLWSLVPLFFAGALMLLYSGWSRSASRGTLDHAQVSHSALRLGGIACVSSLLAVTLSAWLIDLLYGRGAMDAATRQTLAHLLSTYLIGAGPFIAGVVYVRALSAIGRVQVIALASGVGVVTNVLLDWILIHYWGLYGIGLATSATYLIIMLFLHSQWRWLAHHES